MRALIFVWAIYAIVNAALAAWSVHVGDDSAALMFLFSALIAAVMIGIVIVRSKREP